MTNTQQHCDTCLYRRGDYCRHPEQVQRGFSVATQGFHREADRYTCGLYEAAIEAQISLFDLLDDTGGNSSLQAKRPATADNRRPKGGVTMNNSS